eukprot:GFUD01008137.1.p1 GENE.GFUD01008137.1~~GFUD01008137.1.p1  ORF type:complete len:258 (-),score=79.86 GFUD01008137.1:115-888(-)
MSRLFLTLGFLLSGVSPEYVWTGTEWKWQDGPVTAVYTFSTEGSLLVVPLDASGEVGDYYYYYGDDDDNQDNGDPETTGYTLAGISTEGSLPVVPLEASGEVGDYYYYGDDDDNQDDEVLVTTGYYTLAGISTEGSLPVVPPEASGEGGNDGDNQDYEDPRTLNVTTGTSTEGSLPVHPFEAPGEGEGEDNEQDVADPVTETFPRCKQEKCNQKLEEKDNIIVALVLTIIGLVLLITVSSIVTLVCVRKRKASSRAM